ncbi:hypothetical protein LDVICp030 [lymphocystis disease virus-China]|uniref:Uncharacterized protein n=1 Tax=lymphocystis disease virus-China TaxID=256729 RepID=Q678H9_9VIRU|nr:hypothetical protein LDVICp030 [lymphocystis disease virus-China]AAU10878.1 hypothetical protein [lymphocystis disease virus-China]
MDPVSAIFLKNSICFMGLILNLTGTALRRFKKFFDSSTRLIYLGSNMLLK